MRLRLIAHDATDGTRRAVFGDATGLAAPEPVAVSRRRAVVCGPERACRETAGLLTAAGEPGPWEAEVVDDLRAPDMGDWAGRTAEDVLGQDPFALQAWLQDPAFRPPAGESFEEHLARIGRVLDGRSWPEAGAIVVLSPLSLRAACVHALGADAHAALHLDVAPGTTASMSRNAGTWRLSALVPPRPALAAWNPAGR
ncbi:MAG: histidine phosphatase family protein [Arachnia sp.]